MAVLDAQTVGQLVAQNPARARVLEEYRIDYCCGGKLPLAEACERRKVNLEQVLRDLEACDASESDTCDRDWTLAPLTELVQHIVATHHAYLSGELPRLQAMANRVAQVHGDRAPQTLRIAAIFCALCQELQAHTAKEEQILFPWINAMEELGNTGMPFQASVASPIACMEHEHGQAGAALEKLRELTNDYTPPMDACNTWRVLYASLEALEHDMHTHIHKENSILFPRALELEKQLGG